VQYVVAMWLVVKCMGALGATSILVPYLNRALVSVARYHLAEHLAMVHIEFPLFVEGSFAAEKSS
jgi:hypothetical protein